MSRDAIKRPVIPMKIFVLQLLYVASALSYNLVSGLVIPLAPTHPMAGSVFVLVYGLVAFMGRFHWGSLYRSLMAILILFLVVSGIGLHILNFFGNPAAPAGYASVWTLLLAVFINLIGVALAIPGLVSVRKRP